MILWFLLQRIGDLDFCSATTLSRHSFSPLHVLILKWLVINDIINFGAIIAPLPFGDDVIYEQPQIYKWRITTDNDHSCSF